MGLPPLEKPLTEGSEQPEALGVRSELRSILAGKIGMASAAAAAAAAAAVAVVGQQGSGPVSGSLSTGGSPSSADSEHLPAMADHFDSSSSSSSVAVAAAEWALAAGDLDDVEFVEDSLLSTFDEFELAAGMGLEATQNQQGSGVAAAGGEQMSDEASKTLERLRNEMETHPMGLGGRISSTVDASSLQPA